MRKYTGAEPNLIRSLLEISARYLVQTNNGAQYFLNEFRPPRIGDDILSFKFQRAQPYTFQQDGSAFHRMIDGWAIPFAVYLETKNAVINGRVNLEAREMFIEDMARQNIVCRFITA